MTQIREPEALPHKETGVDVVMECAGIFNDKPSALRHIEAGAQKVLISAPANDSDLTAVYGVNHHQLRADHQVVSNASCTTNCLAPVAMVMDKAFGIETGYMTTIHAYTNDQNNLIIVIRICAAHIRLVNLWCQHQQEPPKLLGLFYPTPVKW